MKYLKTFGLILAIMILIFIASSSFSYFDLISNKANNIIKLISILLSLFIGGIYIGSKSIEKGYLEGIKISGPSTLMMIAISFFLLKNKINIWKIIYYILIFITPIIGSIIGINKKEKHK